MIETCITDIIKCDVLYVQICTLDQHIAEFMLQFKMLDVFTTVNLFHFLILFHDTAQTDEELKTVFVGTSALPSIFKTETFCSRDGP